jgi:hypothetical protein
MKKLNLHATRIFSELLKKLNGKEHKKLMSEGFMPLTIEKLEENLLTPWGVGTTYSLCHYYEQNGDLMRDPEMVFIVVDNRSEEKDYENLHIYPKMYQQDNIGIYEESITIEFGKITSYIKAWQAAHVQFAQQWLSNIKEQGFLI